jgi:hypothetical protein
VDRAPHPRLLPPPLRVSASGRRWRALIGAAATVLALGSVSLAIPVAGATTTPVAISGTVRSAVPVEVGVLTPQGAIYLSSPVTTGPYAISIPSSAASTLTNATLQILTVAGAYAGPVVLWRTPETRTVVDDSLGLGPVRAGSHVKLGRIVPENGGTWFLDSGVHKSVVGTVAVRAAQRNGRPYGAGNFGLLRGGIADTTVRPATAKRSSRGRSGGLEVPLTPPHVVAGIPDDPGANPGGGVYAVSCPTTTDPAVTASSRGTPAGTLPGQELDCSGVPNVFNVDVNGNGVLNASDPAAVSEAASAFAFATTTAATPATSLSYYSPDGPDPAELANALNLTSSAPEPSSLVLTISVAASALASSDPSGAGLSVEAICGTLTWCSQATVSSSGTPWSATTPSFALAPGSTAGVFTTTLSFPSGTNPVPLIAAGQFVLLQVTTVSGTTIEVPVEVQPTIAINPVVLGATYSSSGVGPLTADSDGDIVSALPNGAVTLKIERPERVPALGVKTTSGVEDVSGLDYDVTVAPESGGGPVACPADAYANIQRATPGSHGGTPVLVDNTTRDFDPASGTNPGPIIFTVNLSTCVGASWTSGTTYSVGIVATYPTNEAGSSTFTFSLVAG